jgi:hypothetical protein
MRLLHRLLTGPHGRRGRHLASCPECRLQQRRERQYLERLRGAEIPTASDELTARLLARTEELAREEPPAFHRPAPVRRFRPALRAAVLVAGGATAATVLLGGSAYLVGGDPGATAGAAPASVLLQRDLSVSGAASLGTLPGEGAGAPAGWGLTGEPDFIPPEALTGDQLSTLRTAGWTCPELRELGYRLVWARAGELDGGELLELRLTNGRNYVTVLEQHGSQLGPVGSLAGEPAAPVYLLTGRAANLEGFTAAALPGGPTAANAAPGTERHTAGTGDGFLWVKHASPFAAIYQTGGATFTFVSDQPAEQAVESVAELVRSRSTAAPATGDGPAGGTGLEPGAEAGTGAGLGDPAGADGGGNLALRLERGLARIVELLAP